RAKHKVARKEFKEKWAARPPSEYYYPAPNLPPDAVLVVRTAALMELHAAATRPPASKAKTEIGTRERETLLKMLLGMAMECYRYSPDADRNPATAEIVSDLAKHGLSVGEDTVRGRLKEAAANLLPRQSRSS